MAAARVLVLSAVFPEARALARAFRLTRATGAVLPTWHGDETNLSLVGVGAGHLAKLDQANMVLPEVIVMAGVAGALSPALRVGDVVAEARGSPIMLPPLGRAFQGRILSTQGLVASTGEKSRLFRQSGCLAVDMETAVVAEFAARQKIPFVALRGISDAADASLNPALLMLLDQDGNPRVGRALAMILRRPAMIFEMLRLHRASTTAMASVAEALRLLITSGWPRQTAERRSDT